MTTTMVESVRALTFEEEMFFKKMKETANVVLNEVQMQSCLHHGTQLLLAAPGTGKTTTTITKIGYMIDVLKINPSQILAVTFSKAAAIDMQSRFKKFFPEHPEGIVHFSTIHSLSYEIFRKYMYKKNLKYQLIEGEKKDPKQDQGKMKVISQIYRGIIGEYPSEEIRESLQSYISLLKNLLLSPSEYEKAYPDAEIVTGADEVFIKYEEYKRSQSIRLIDYDDMLAEGLRILEEDDEIRTEYQNKFKFLLMDEAQDTSLVQHRIAEVLSEIHQNLFMVADDDQTIYGFRGSDVENLLIFKDKYPNGIILKMEHNYRSTKNIVATANTFIKNVKNRYDKNMFTEKEDGEPIDVTIFSTHGNQLDEMLRHIKSKENLSEVAVLYRNNSSSIAVAHTLMKHNIPFYVKDVDSKFFNHFVMVDLRNYLRLAYGDKVKYMKLLQDIGPRFKGYLTKAHFEELSTFDSEMNMWDALCEIPTMKPYQKTFFKECKRTFAKMKDMKPILAIETVLEQLEYEKALDKYVKFLNMNAESVERIISTIKRIAQSSDNLVDFYKVLDDLANAMKEAKKNRGKNAVTLSTFHASKGLEYETVFMIDLQEGQVPTFRERKSLDGGNLKALDEAYRLFYVGMTRAKRCLHLYAYKVNSKPSEFVKNVEKIIKKKGMYSPKALKSVADSEMKSKSKVTAKVNEGVWKASNNLTKTDLVVGETIHHKSFGEGVIQSIDDEVIRIHFKLKGVKNLSVKSSLQFLKK